jgi:GNAT superfamily N-acetyltransferase
MSTLPFSPVGEDERTTAFATLVSAFMDDPFERWWMYPRLQQYLMHFPTFLEAFAGSAFEEGTVWSIGEFAAVALWLPPGAEPDGDAIVAVLRDTLPRTKHADVFAVLDQMEAAHPTHPHWYLPWFGVHADQQGKGVGSQLMAQCLSVVDADHLPAYLESPNPRNVTFYERHGFTVTGEARAGAAPPVVFMARPAQ